GAADDPGVTGESTLPEPVAQDRHARPALERLFVGEDAPEQRRRAEDLEQVAGDAQRLQPLRLPLAGQEDLAGAAPVEIELLVRGDVREDGVLRLPVGVIR